MDYNEKLKLDTWLKRTQSKPILLSLMAGKIALLASAKPKAKTGAKPKGLYEPALSRAKRRWLIAEQPL